MKNKINLIFSLILGVFPLTLTSCFTFFQEKQKEPNMTKKESKNSLNHFGKNANEKNQSLESNKHTKKQSNLNNLIKQFPNIDIEKNEGLDDLWNYILGLRNLIKQENLDIDDSDKNSINQKLLLKYDQLIQDLTSSQIFDQKSKTKYQGLKDKFLQSWEKTISLDKSNDNKELKEFKKLKKDESRFFDKNLGLTLVVLYTLIYFDNNISLIDFYIDYINLEKMLITKINDSQKTFKEQFNTKEFKKLFEQIADKANKFLDPLNHFMATKDELFLRGSKSNHKQMYKFIIDFMNELTPLYIEMGWNQNNPISKWHMNKWVKEYFYKDIKSEIKLNFTKDEVQKSYSKWLEKSKEKYGFVFKKEELKNFE
ncbi:hypothetical protein [Mycoplasmopsis pulmonis]|uniref:hypothetical protein n=1 Tax=Mycoplasmopsis pulmonis TaxID=2107 RepID=UPI002ACEDF8A|nr:hypothetical protein [Mycoplasmopsis pulmonis]MDZ7293325.1 hypothetical protein [Mycoplasmopsis pulmonis]